eukprot:3939779-Alexandrium_andersonii.AAC.1
MKANPLTPTGAFTPRSRSRSRPSPFTPTRRRRSPSRRPFSPLGRGVDLFVLNGARARGRGERGRGLRGRGERG